MYQNHQKAFDPNLLKTKLIFKPVESLNVGRCETVTIKPEDDQSKTDVDTNDVKATIMVTSSHIYTTYVIHM